MNTNQSAVAVSCIAPNRNRPHHASFFNLAKLSDQLRYALAKFFIKKVCFLVFVLFASYNIQAQNCTVNAGISQQVCGTTATLTGNRNGSTNGNPEWSFVSGPATPVIVTPTSVSTNITGMSEGGVYTFKLSQLCQDGTTASQNVTVTAYPQPVFSAGTPFVFCGTSQLTQTLDATLPTGWTGVWSVIDAVYPTSDNTSRFTFSNINSPTSTVTYSTQSCPKASYVFIWKITSPNGLCSYSKQISGKWNPLPAEIGWNTAAISRCFVPNFQIGKAAGKCGFWSGYNPDYVLTSSIVSAPAGYVGNITFGTSVGGDLDVFGFTLPGHYVFNINLTSPCGNATYGPFDVTLAPGAPGVSSPALAGYCFKSAPASIPLSYTVSNSTDVLTVVSSSRPPGADPITIVESGSGTNRVFTVSPNTKWAPGTYTINFSAKSAADVSGQCAAPLSTSFYIYDTLSTSLEVADINRCLAVGSSTVNVTVPLPAYPAYLSSSFGPRWRLTKIAGPSAGSAGAISDYYGSIVALTGLVAGEYRYRIAPVGTFFYNEIACSAGPYDDTFSIRIYSTPGANAGTDQSTACIQNFPLAANAITAPSYGTWSQVSGPSTVTFSNIHSPNASTSVVGSPLLGDYTFRWTVQDSAGSCAIATDDVVLHLISDNSPAGVDQSICSYSTATMAGIGVGSWSARTTPANPGAATITSPTASNTTITGFDAGGVYAFVWDYGCDKDTVLITVRKPDAGTDKIACQFSNATMSATGTGVWAAQTGNPGTATITNTSLPTTTVTSFSWPGTYNYIWTSEGCADTTKVTVSTCQGTGANICSATQIYPRPVEGTSSRVSLIISVNVSVPGTFAVSVAGSGMTIAQGFSGITTNSTGIQNFTIPLVYDGSTLGAFSYAVTGAGTCNATLSNNPTQRICDLFSIDNCSPPVAGPSLQ